MRADKNKEFIREARQGCEKNKKHIYLERWHVRNYDNASSHPLRHTGAGRYPFQADGCLFQGIARVVDKSLSNYKLRHDIFSVYCQLPTIFTTIT